MSADQSELAENLGDNSLSGPFSENLAIAECIGDIATTQQLNDILDGATSERYSA